MRFTSLPEWLAWLEACHPAEIELGLERIARVAARLSVDLSSATVVSIAGTNGKGSCIAALNALATDAGWQVGCYTSPHLLTYNERIVVNGAPVSDELLMEAFARVDAALEGDSLTYFEFGTLAALDIFQRSNLDLVLLEVGLGGRLDAVNIIDADISVVTSIALDHQDWLGDNREAIGFEKAGIYRQGQPAICADESPPQSLVDHAVAIGASLQLRGKDFDLTEHQGGNFYWWCGGEGRDKKQPVAGLNQLPLPLPSVAAAFRVADYLGIGQEHWQSVGSVDLAGRFQLMLCAGHRVILDVAHNPQAAELLARRLAQQSSGGLRYAIFAAMADKDIAAMIEPLENSFSAWLVAGLPGNNRAATVGELAVKASQQLDVPVIAHDDVPQACARILPELQAGDEVVIFGSFFTVAAAMAYLHTQGSGSG